MSILPTLHTEEAAREAARKARLRYVRDTEPGITRQKTGDVFHYFAPTRERTVATGASHIKSRTCA